MECQDYHCVCEAFMADEPIPGVTGETAREYCRECSCHEEDHGAGFRADEQHDADEGSAAIEALFGSGISLN